MWPALYVVYFGFKRRAGARMAHPVTGKQRACSHAGARARAWFLLWLLQGMRKACKRRAGARMADPVTSERHACSHEDARARAWLLLWLH